MTILKVGFILQAALLLSDICTGWNSYTLVEANGFEQNHFLLYKKKAEVEEQHGLQLTEIFTPRSGCPVDASQIPDAQCTWVMSENLFQMLI